jgi:hypothetical protein
MSAKLGRRLSFGGSVVARITISQALAFGFGLLRRQWRAVLVWSGLYLVASLAAYGILIGEWTTFSDPAIPEAELARLEANAFGWNLLSIILSEAATVLILCAVIRAVLHPDDRAFFYLRFSARELWVVIASLAGCLLVLAPLLPAAVLGLFALHAPPADSGPTPLMVAAFTAALAGIVAAAWIGLRLIALLPLAFEQKRVPLKEAWRLTRGHAWRILLLILNLAAAVIFIGIALFMVTAVISVAVGVPLIALTAGAFGSYVLPAVTAIGLVMMVLGAGYIVAVNVVTNGAWVDLYRQLTMASEQTLAETAA